MRLVIVVEGGLIQDIFSDGKDVEAIICDHDTEGSDESELMKSPQCGDMGHHSRWTPLHEPGLVEAWFERYREKELED